MHVEESDHENDTDSPDDAVADGRNNAESTPNVLSGIGGKSIVWFTFTAKLRDTCDAAFQLASPAWLARIVHVPPPTIVTVVPDTVHTEVVVVENVTVKPDGDALADTSNGRSRNTLSPSGPKLIVCSALATLKLCDTVGAAL